MRSNNDVCDELIDWNNIPKDAIFQLTFPQPEMFDESTINETIKVLKESKLSNQCHLDIRLNAEKIRANMNPSTAESQLTSYNVPKFSSCIDENNKLGISGMSMPGMQHVYRETCLFFAAEAQYCHSFCTYCFRWAQFTSVGNMDQQLSYNNANLLHKYISQHKSITDIIYRW